MAITLDHPANNNTVVGNVLRFGFYIPAVDRLIFKLDIDTVNTFDSVNLLTYESRYEQALWKYYENDLWNLIEPAGIMGRNGIEARAIINKYRESNFPQIETLFYWKISSSDNITEKPIYNQFTFGTAIWGGTNRGLYNQVIWNNFIYD